MLVVLVVIYQRDVEGDLVSRKVYTKLGRTRTSQVTSSDNLSDCKANLSTLSTREAAYGLTANGTRLCEVSWNRMMYL